MILGNENKYAKQLQVALTSGSEEEQQQAWNDFSNSIVESIKADAEIYAQTGDKNILAQRGYRQLTSAEERFYDKFIEDSKCKIVYDPFAGEGDLLKISDEYGIEECVQNLMEYHI